MATTVANETAAQGAANQSPSARASAAKPDVEKIMADIRRSARARAEEATKSEREFRTDVKKRMLAPLTRGFSDDFADQIRSRDASRWNIRLAAADFHGADVAPMRVLRWLLTPLARVLVHIHPAVRQVTRQAEINEYHRRLLWATNRDLELARLEIGVIKSELRRLGVHADFSFSAGSGGESSARGGGSGRGRQDGRSGRQDRNRSDRGRGDGRGDRDGGGRRDRQSSPSDSRSGNGSSSRSSRQPSRPSSRPPSGHGNRPNRGGRRPGPAAGDR